MIHRVKRNEHDAKDREILMGISRKSRFVPRYWREERIRALIAGWPRDLEVKREAIQSITTERYHGEEVFDRDDARIILIEGFPQDDEVAEVIASLFQTEERLNLSLDLDFNSRSLVEGFCWSSKIMFSCR